MWGGAREVMPQYWGFQPLSLHNYLPLKAPPNPCYTLKNHYHSVAPRNKANRTGFVTYCYL